MVKVQRSNVPIFLIVLVIAAILFIVVALFSAGNMAVSPRAQLNDLEMSSTSIAFANEQVVSQLQATQTASEGQQQNQERIIIRNATLRIVVGDTQAALSEIAELAEAWS
jgi:sensor histidine kinase regulating citrate/malate metabolism